MSTSPVLEFGAVDATAADVAAWCAAAAAAGDGWAHGGEDEPWDLECDVDEVFAALAASAVSAALEVWAAPTASAGTEQAPDPLVPPRAQGVPHDLADWVEPQWWWAPMRPEVRRLMVMAPGPGLVAALQEVGAAAVCPVDHRHPTSEVEAVDALPVPGSGGHPCACQLIVAAGWEAASAWVALRAGQALVSAAGAEVVVDTPPRFGRGRTVDPARNELAPVLRLSPVSTHTRISAARALAAHPDLSDLVAKGMLFGPGMRCVLTETANLSDVARAKVIAEVVAKIEDRRRAGRPSWTPGELRMVVKRLVMSLAAAEVDQARAKAKARRRVGLTPDADGMAFFSALIADVDAHRIYNRLTAVALADAADAPDDDQRTADQRRADAFVAALLGHSAARTGSDDDTPTDASDNAPADTPTNASDDAPADTPTDASDNAPADTPTNAAEQGDGGPAHPAGASADEDCRSTGPLPRSGRPEINVVVTLATLLGLTRDPGHVPGLGPIPADVARALAADAGWRLWITDAVHGNVVATGARRYTPSASVARLVRAREPMCRMPGCARQAINCDLDHTVPYPAGPTMPGNLGPLCRRDHNLKTHHGFHLGTHAPPDSGDIPGGWTWTFPSGLTHRGYPEPPLPDGFG